MKDRGLHRIERMRLSLKSEVTGVIGLKQKTLCGESEENAFGLRLGIPVTMTMTLREVRHPSNESLALQARV